MRTSGRVGGDVAIAYERDGRGPLVVFLHGIGGNRSNWYGQLDALKGDYCAVTWDARGYGDSGDPPPPLRFGQFAEDLVRLVDHLGADRAHIVGLSMGGMIAQDFASRFPDRVAALALVDTSSGFGAAPEPVRRDFLAQRLDPLDQGRTPADIAPLLVGALVAPTASASVREQVRASVAALRTEPYRQALHAIVTTDFRDVLPALKVPTLVLVGDEDVVTPPASSRYLAEVIPRADLVTIPGAGHLSNLDQPELFNRALRAFLDRHAERATIIAGR